MSMLGRKQRGDTLIEVLFAMAVIGLSLGISYGIANRALATGRNAQERTEALKLAESQIERMKANLDDGFLLTDYRDTDAYCVLSGVDKEDMATDPGSPCLEVDGSFYNLRIEYLGGPPESFNSIVEWDVPNSLQQGRVELLYRP